jgi:thioredoxin reductase (NADPH)
VSGLNQISVAVGHAAIAATAIHRRLPFNPWPTGGPEATTAAP